MLDYEIHGGKGGEKKPHTPVETPNNLLSVAIAKVLIAVAEGELAGVPTDQDIFLDGTPLANPDGSKNFGGVKWEWRPGTTDQTYIAGLPEVSTEYNVGIELKYGTPYVRSVTKSELDAVRVTFQWPALLEQTSNGDTIGVSMDYNIEISTAGGPFVEYQRYNINGKTNTAYERTHRVDLPESSSGWIIRANKLTPDATSGTIQDTINIKSVAEVVDVKQRYPNTALLYVEFDSRMFGAGSIPRVSVRTKGRIIRVPSNYDPLTRTYAGIWNGSFKWSWSDNPAWVYHDIITQDRFGLGNKVTLDMIDKWALYEIAQYCDVMVDDGHGAGVLQPRHTMNVYIQDKQDAWKVLRDIATAFNGMTYWNGNQFTAIADKQESFNNAPVFSRSNVVNGRFEYQAADDKSIYTSALVSYDDPDNHYDTEVESTFETDQILRWGGDRQIEISAIGCTSRGEAQRRGKYTLITNMYNRTVSFRTGLQGLNDEVMPGKLIHVVDPLIGGRPFTGRIIVAAGRVLTLDRPVDASVGDIMYITRADGSSEGRTIQAVAGNIVTVQVAYTELPKPNAVWYLEAADLKSQLFRVTKITMPEESVYEIEGVEYNDSKYAAIDNGARLEPRPISVVPPNIQQAPTNVVINSHTYTEQMLAVSTMVISWDQTPNAVGYEVQWKVGNGDWINAGETGALEVNIKGIYTGQYLARVRAVNPMGIKSVWSSSTLTTLNGKVGSPPALTSLTVTPIVFGMQINWTFAPNSEDTARTELMYSMTPSFDQAIKLGDFAYPQVMHEMNGLKAGQTFYFWGRIIDRSGNVGPFFPLTTANGVQGISSTDVNEYEEYFREQITESALGQHLSDRIDLIDGPPDMSGSVNERIKVLDDQVSAVTDDLQTQIDGIADLADSMPYDPTATYTTGQAVLGADGILYQAKQAVPINTAPPNTTYWTDIGQAVNTANGLAARVTTVETTVTTQGGQIAANASAINGLQTQINDKASSAAVDSLTTRVTAAEGNITAQGQAITGLQTQVNGKADASALNALTTRVTAAEGNIATQAGQISSLTTTVAGKADSSVVAALQSTVTQQGNTITSQGQAISSIQTTLGGLGLDPAPNSLWNFDASLEGWTSFGSTLFFFPGSMTITSTSTAPILVSPSGLSISGVLYPKIKMKIIRTSGSGWGGRAYFATASHTFDANYYKSIPNPNLGIGGGVVLDIDMSSLTVGGNDWTASIINALRFDLGVTNTDTFVIEWIAVGRDGPSASSSAFSSLSATVTQQGNTITSQGNAITSLTSRVSAAESNITGQAGAIDSLDTRVTNNEGAISAQATRLDGIYVQVNPTQAGDTAGYAGDSQYYAGVWSEQSARIEDGVAMGQRVDGLKASVDNNAAQISNEQTVRANADSALAVQQSTTQAQVNGLTVTTQQTSSALATLDGKTQAMWAVKLQVNAQGQYVTAGIGLGLENTPGGLQSTFLVNADTFAVVNGLNTTVTTPFVVTGGQVFIKSAVIQDGSITNAKIGQVIQSDNYVFNTSGWAINKTGGFEMNGASGGGRMQLTGTALKFYHPNGVLGIDLSL